jgi:hypothetical protein
LTHVELLSSVQHPGTPLLKCNGELAHHGDFPDLIPRDGTIVERTVSLWICRGCGHILSVSEGTLLNDYPPPMRLASSQAEAHKREEAP